MKKGVEFILLPIIAFVIYTKPRALVKFSGTFLGKLVMLVLVATASLHNPMYGIVAATLMVLTLECGYEVMEGLDVNEDTAADALKTLIDDAVVDASDDAEEGDDEEGDADDEQLLEHEDGEQTDQAPGDQAPADQAPADQEDGVEPFSRFANSCVNDRIDVDEQLRSKDSNDEYSKYATFN